MLKHARNINNSGIRLHTQNYNNTAPKLQKCWTHKIALKIISNMLKQPNFFHSRLSTLPKDAPAKFYLSTDFDFKSFRISSVAPTRSLTFYAYLITKIGNRNLKESSFVLDTLLSMCTFAEFTVKSWPIVH